MRPSLALLVATITSTLLLAIGLSAPAPVPASPEKEVVATAPPAPEVAVLSSLEKVLPGDRPRGARSIELRAMRGECEAAQIAVHAGPVSRTIEARIARAPGAGVEIHLYRVALVQLLRPSGPEGATGRWPDPLVPVVDRSVGEARRAFPLEVAAGETRSILVDVCVARDAEPGERVGAIGLVADGREIPIRFALRIEPLQIPATAGLPTTFGFSSRRAAHGHHGKADSMEEVLRLDRLYRSLLLAHRVSAHGGTFDPPPFRRGPRGLEVDFTDYDRELAPFLDGSALPSGARATTVELRTHPDLASDRERIAYWRAIAAHHRARGWKALLFDYAHDEPRRDELPAIRQRGLLVKKADPSIRVLLTASLDPKLEGAVDLWAPNLNCLFVKKSPDEWCAWRAPLGAYRQAEKRGALLWWYQSCSSHGCDDRSIVGARSDAAAAYFRGWPSYVVDAPGTRARAMAWLAFAEDIGGELYWDTVYAFAPKGEARDPWSPGGLWAFGGNGDGTLLYPGTPERIGGSTHVPLPSLRLIHIRDGLEDWELLQQVARLPGGEREARETARRLVPATFRIDDDPAAFERARHRLLDRLAAARSTAGE